MHKLDIQIKLHKLIRAQHLLTHGRSMQLKEEADIHVWYKTSMRENRGSPEPVTQFGRHKKQALGLLGLQAYLHSIPAYVHLEIQL